MRFEYNFSDISSMKQHWFVARNASDYKPIWRTNEFAWTETDSNTNAQTAITSPTPTLAWLYDTEEGPGLNYEPKVQGVRFIYQHSDVAATPTAAVAQGTVVLGEVHPYFTFPVPDPAKPAPIEWNIYQAAFQTNGWKRAWDTFPVYKNENANTFDEQVRVTLYTYKATDSNLYFLEAWAVDKEDQGIAHEEDGTTIADDKKLTIAAGLYPIKVVNAQSLINGKVAVSYAINEVNNVRVIKFAIIQYTGDQWLRDAIIPEHPHPPVTLDTSVSFAGYTWAGDANVDNLSYGETLNAKEYFAPTAASVCADPEADRFKLKIQSSYVSPLYIYWKSPAGHYYFYSQLTIGTSIVQESCYGDIWLIASAHIESESDIVGVINSQTSWKDHTPLNKDEERELIVGIKEAPPPPVDNTAATIGFNEAGCPPLGSPIVEGSD
jgi:hypothetical protein